jgi:hypothetical protein
MGNEGIKLDFLSLFVCSDLDPKNYFIQQFCFELFKKDINPGKAWQKNIPLLAPSYSGLYVILRQTSSKIILSYGANL